MRGKGAPASAGTRSDVDTAVGESCYVAPLVVWLTHLPPSSVLLVQSEQLFADPAGMLQWLRCWAAAPYEFGGDPAACTRPREEPQARREQQASRGRKQEGIVRRLSAELYRPCTQRLLDLLREREFRGMVLAEWDVRLWPSAA